MSLRRLHVLIHGLPFHSRFWTAAAGHSTQWTHTDYLLARLIDVQSVAHLKDPKPLERPGEREARERALQSRIDRWMNRRQRRAGR